MKTRLGVALLSGAFALSAALAAGESPARGSVSSNELENEIRSELDSLRERIEDLEMLLATLVTTREAEMATTGVEPGGDQSGCRRFGRRGLGYSRNRSSVHVHSAVRCRDARGSREHRGAAALDHGSRGHLLHPQHERSRRREQHACITRTRNARGFGLNQLKLEIETAGDGPFGFRSDIWFGSGARLFRDGLEPGPLADVPLSAAGVRLLPVWKRRPARRGSLRDHRGARSRGIASELELHARHPLGLERTVLTPRSSAGAYRWTDTFTGTLLLVNGLDNAWDQNTGKSYGVQGSLAPNDQFQHHPSPGSTVPKTPARTTAGSAT